MISVLMQFIPLAFAAITPTMVMFVVALLPSDKGPAKSIAVVVGRYIAHLLIAFGFVFFLRERNEDPTRSGVDSRLLSMLFLNAGIVLIVMAVWQIFRGDSDIDKPPSRVAMILKSVNPLVLALANFVIVFFSIRLLALVAAGAAIISEANLNDLDEIVLSLILAFAMVLGIAIPLLVYFAMGERGPQQVEKIGDWMKANRRILNIAVLSLIGGGLAVKGMTGL